MEYSVTPVGIIRSPYQEKFGIPRQPALAPSAPVTLELLPPYNQPDCVRGLEDFSHVWLTFVFHDTLARGWQPLVRPPRLGGTTQRPLRARTSSTPCTRRAVSSPIKMPVPKALLAPSRRAARLTVSPMAVYEKRVSEPMLPTTAGPLWMPIRMPMGGRPCACRR